MQNAENHVVNMPTQPSQQVQQPTGSNNVAPPFPGQPLQQEQQPTGSNNVAPPLPAQWLDEKPIAGAITVQSRIADFWTIKPRLWFHHFESIVDPQRPSDLHKAQLLTARLSRDELSQVSDILDNPPETMRYQALKDRLISAYSQSDTYELQQLLTELELGDMKPTQLLRKMRELSKNKLIPEDTLRLLWLGRLPHFVRAVVTVCGTVDLNSVASIADKIMESSRHTVNAINKPPTSPPALPSTSQTHAPQSHSSLEQKIDSLVLEIAAMNRRFDQRNTSQDRGRTTQREQPSNRDRSSSRSRAGINFYKFCQQKAQPGDPDFKCFYHYSFGNQAKKCGDTRCSQKSLN